ncbi:MAG: response regulator [Bacteroidetes bacterium]|uniref:Response regulator n=1 Tax=Phaeocystidibacter marisrubri TaxID=1577780 RepID=A0A6L3ZIB8_9FLAO|nr:response regulator [Phaeocystidibacter marisrubri]KAB2817624.1 response regulator [Phaeocystidibacter marisrubri]TNE29934.1 MAG: response regulator [Bacteroidota bacterium]GGH74423.1 response regulator [Phaeocystidibacter marisrubri]
MLHEGSKEIICIIDDDEVYQYTATKSIKSSSVVKRVLVFGDGEEAFNYLNENLGVREKLPDIIFLDINMPYMDGWEFMEQFVKIKPKLSKPITVYMISSSVVPDDIEKANSISDISDYIIKPITQQMFREILDTKS